MMLLALSVVTAALFALPPVASATPAHITPIGNFTVTKGASKETATLHTAGGEKVECHKGVTGSGSFENSTTGTLNLEFHDCTSSGFTCTSHASEGGTGISGTISTTPLPLHLIMVEKSKPGVLLTPNASGFFAHFTCAGGLVVRTVTGNGIIGTITSPGCGVASSTATLKFEESAVTGIQKHTTYTGTPYHLHSVNGTKAAETAEGQIHFSTGARTISCT